MRINGLVLGPPSGKAAQRVGAEVTVRGISRPFGVALALVCLSVVLAAAPVWGAARPRQVTQALDYLHACQEKSGGFGQSTVAPAFTPWAVLAVAAAGEDPTGASWQVGGKGPLDYLAELDIAKSATSANNPEDPATTYAQTILAYAAAGQTSLASSAGSKSIDLVASMLAFAAADGHFSVNATGGAAAASASTTAWAVLALVAVNDPANKKTLTSAVGWLQGQPGADGGFGSRLGSPSTVPDTALVIVALRAAGVSDGSDTLTGGLAFLKSQQLDDGGFPAAAGDTTSDAAATAWAVQAVLAAGQDPSSAGWQQGGETPLACLEGLQVASGGFDEQAGVPATSPLTCPEVIVALANKTLPVQLASTPVAMAFKPHIDSFTPDDGSTLTADTVTVKATYGDGAGGTGVNAAAVRLVVDGQAVTAAAKASTLAFKATGLDDGQHTLGLSVADNAGNTTTVTHTFTVAQPTATSSPTDSSSADAASTSGDSTTASDSVPAPDTAGATSADTTTGDSTGDQPVVSSTDSGTTDASPAAAAAGAPSAQPSPDVQPSPPTPSRRSRRRVPIDGFVEGGLALLLPLGALSSHMVYRRRMAAVAALVRGGAPSGRWLVARRALEALSRWNALQVVLRAVGWRD